MFVYACDFSPRAVEFVKVSSLAYVLVIIMTFGQSPNYFYLVLLYIRPFNLKDPENNEHNSDFNVVWVGIFFPKIHYNIEYGISHLTAEADLSSRGCKG